MEDRDESVATKSVPFRSVPFGSVLLRLPAAAMTAPLAGDNSHHPHHPHPHHHARRPRLRSPIQRQPARASRLDCAGAAATPPIMHKPAGKSERASESLRRRSVVSTSESERAEANSAEQSRGESRGAKPAFLCFPPGGVGTRASCRGGWRAEQPHAPTARSCADRQTGARAVRRRRCRRVREIVFPRSAHANSRTHTDTQTHTHTHTRWSVVGAGAASAACADCCCFGAPLARRLLVLRSARS